MAIDAATNINEYLTSDRGAVLLERLPIFDGFSFEELARIYSLGEVRVYKPQSNILIEGESTVGMYLVLEGQVAVYKAGKGANTEGHLLAHLGPGSAFGEMSFIDRQPRSATVVAQGTVVAYYLDGLVWQKTLDAESALAQRFFANFARVLCARLRSLDEQLITSQKQLWKFALSRSNEVS
ncbi:MAG: hypothetical protein RIR26_2822 [Pseudomonadota bacterium]|jgi:CRP-like cAMP-binding protein